MYWKKTTCCLLLLLLALSLIPGVQAAEPVMHFPDRNLETAVRDALNRPTGILTPADMLELVALDGGRYDIGDLTGLEKAVNLETLSLYGNRVEDLSPLFGLTKLRSLNLYHNRVSNLTPLSGLTGLEQLYLGGNRISSLSPLSSLTALQELYLFENNIHDITPLASLVNLETLNLNHNNISNFSPLQSLKGNLSRLSIQGNRYQAISFMQPLTGLHYLELGNASLQDIAPLATLTQLEQLLIHNTAVSDIEALQSLTSLEWLSLENNRIMDLTSLIPLQNLAYLNLNNNWIREIEPLPELESLAWLEIRNNLLDVYGETREMEIIASLLARDTVVSYEQQMFPRFRGDGSVIVPAGSAGKVIRTSPLNYFTILNHGLGWRVQSFTVEHEGGAPQDYIREVGRFDLGAGQFAWYTTPGRHQPSVENNLPYTVTFRNPSTIQLGLSVLIWPGYAHAEERLFYLSQITLWNMHTKSLYTIELDPAETREPIPVLEAETGPLRIESVE